MRPVIDQDLCKSCGYCTSICPKRILVIDEKKINAKGYHPVTVTDPELCIGCKLCEYACPDFAIHIEK